MHFLLDKGYFMLAYLHYPKQLCSVQCPVFFVVLYGCIGPRFSTGVLAGSLLIFCVSVAGGIVQAIWGRHSIQICCGLSCTSFSKARSLCIALAQWAVFIHSCMRFSIIILISFIKEGVGGIVLGQTSCLFYTLSCKPKQASHFLPKIILWLPKSVIKKGTLYCLCLSTQK